MLAMQSVAALCLTLGLLLLCANALKHYAPRLKKYFPLATPSKRITLKESLPLTRQHTAHIVRVDNHSFLVVTSPSGSSIEALPKAIQNPPKKPKAAPDA
jgi:flagellar biogenesis protein FliO